ncbi:MAG: hypothetical protein ACAH07_06105 [Methylophilaceae bacterium]|nr:hypothetical protein [Methyloradius sp.]
MSIDQQIQIWNAAGTWLAAIGTLAAVIFALYTSKKAVNQDLDIRIGIRSIVGGFESSDAEFVSFQVTNKGLNTVTINNLGWKAGRGKKKLLCIQMIDRQLANSIPKELAHGQTASFMFSLTEGENWLLTSSKSFIDETGDKELKSLRGIVSTTLQQFYQPPEAALIKRLKAAYKP